MAGEGKAACHSDATTDDEAKQLQMEQGVAVVQLNTDEVNRLPKHDPII